MLHYFLVAADRRNITTAAAALHITQPALTRSIHELEKQVGAQLFERLPTGVVLTQQGEILARRARLMQLEYEHALSEIRTLGQGLAGTLRIGAGPMWLSTILPGAVAEFHRRYPKVRLRLTGGVINTLVDALLAGEIDLMCGTLDFRPQPEITRETLLRVRHTVISRRNHPLASRGTVLARELARFPWLVLANDQIGISRIGAYFAANGLAPPTIAVEADALPMFKILQQGDFLAHFAEEMLPDAQRLDLVRIPHEGMFWESEAGIAYRTTNQPLQALTRFTSILKAGIPRP